MERRDDGCVASILDDEGEHASVPAIDVRRIDAKPEFFDGRHDQVHVNDLCVLDPCGRLDLQAESSVSGREPVGEGERDRDGARLSRKDRSVIPGDVNPVVVGPEDDDLIPCDHILVVVDRDRDGAGSARSDLQG